MTRQLRIFLTLLSLPFALAAQGGTHVLIVSGLSAEPAAAVRFAASARPIVKAARLSWGVADSSLVYLGEHPGRDDVTDSSTATRIRAAFARIASRSAPGDLVLVVLVGHGSGEGAESKLSIPGPDLTAQDYADLLMPLQQQQVVFVVGASGSGDFLPVLSARGRVVITATKTALERNESIFSVFMAEGLTDPAADTNKDGVISVLEAFTFASTRMAKEYVDTKRLQTEHPLLDDNGDRAGSEEPEARTVGVDGYLAARVSFGGKSATNPRVAALMAERRVLERQVDELKERKSFMQSADYQKELERLLLAIAEKTAAIRELGGNQ